MKILKVKCLAPTRLDNYLTQQYPALTPGRLNKALRENKIKLNGKKQPLSTRVMAGDEIKLFILDDVLEGEFLFCRGKLSTAAKTGFHKFRMRCLGIPCIKHNRVDVCASVGKCREYKTGVRCADNPVTDTWTYAVFVLTVAKSRFGQVDRADRTQQIFVNFLRLV